MTTSRILIENLDHLKVWREPAAAERRASEDLAGPDGAQELARARMRTHMAQRNLNRGREAWFKMRFGSGTDQWWEVDHLKVFN